MKVELGSSHVKALLKGCLWMGEADGSSEGGQNETSQQPQPREQSSLIKTYS